MPLMDEQTPQFLAFGDLGVDAVAGVDRLPREDDKIWAEPKGEFPGGMMGNVATIVRRLGVSAGVIGCVGSDARGDMVLDELQDRNVDTSRVRVVEDPTFWTLALTTDSGERALIQFPTTAFYPHVETAHEGAVRAARWIHTSAEQGAGAEHFLQLGRHPQAVASVDVEFPFVLEDYTSRIIALTDVVFMNRAAAAAWGGPRNAAMRACELGADVAVVTLGAQGCVVVTPETYEEVCGVRVAAIDTNGAGDAFAAGYAVAGLRGWAASTCASFANVVAAVSTLALGGHGAAVNPAAVRSLAASAGYPWGESVS